MSAEAKYNSQTTLPLQKNYIGGVGRENGLQAIEHYTQVKTIYANLGDVPVTY